MYRNVREVVVTIAAIVSTARPTQDREFQPGPIEPSIFHSIAAGTSAGLTRATEAEHEWLSGPKTKRASCFCFDKECFDNSLLFALDRSRNLEFHTQGGQS